jgi:hypothetical protein
MVEHVEVCLTSFMQNFPPNYRSKPLPEQPDIVWGQRVLPNFRSTLQSLNTGFILLSHGDVNGLDYAHGPGNDFKGQLDYWSGWMAKEDEDRYTKLLDRAVQLAHNIVQTEGAYWRSLELNDYSLRNGVSGAPVEWPHYQINKNISVRTGDKTQQSGIYVPDLESGCAEFLSTNYGQAPTGAILVGHKDLIDPTTGERYYEEPVFEQRVCTWYLVERVMERDLVAERRASESGENSRVLGGEPCPESGFYFTPARPDSRRLFQRGDVMPTFDAVYGKTIWQRDGNQV